MDKLTKIVSVKLTPEMAQTAHLIAESMGFELSEYIRHLMTSDIKRARGQYATLHQVFGSSTNQSTITGYDLV